MEILGTIASVIVLFSFIATEEKRIRIINIFGAALFVVYGLLINAFSVWLLNGILILVHSWYLFKDREVMQCGKGRPDSPVRANKRRTKGHCQEGRHCIRQGQTREADDA
jgi:hypothetical protein